MEQSAATYSGCVHTEAGNIAAASSKGALWLKKLLPSVGIEINAMKMYGDNHGALKLIRKPIEPSRFEHTDVINHFIRKQVAKGEGGGFELRRHEAHGG